MSDNPVTEAGPDLAAISAERDRLRSQYLREDRPPSSARGVHHVALLSSDVERTIRFYQGVLEFPLTEIFENRDYAGSNHFFFDLGHGNLLAFFDFPGLDLGPYDEVLGGLCTTWRSRSSPSAGPGCATSCTRPGWATRRKATRRCTSTTPTAHASS